MGKLGKSFTLSGVFTLYIMCFYYGIGVFVTIAQGGNVVEFAGSSIVAAIVCFVFLTFAIYQLLESFEELNRPRDTDKHPADKRDRQDSGDASNQPEERR